MITEKIKAASLMPAALVLLIMFHPATFTDLIRFENLLEEENQLEEEACYTALVTITRTILY